MRGSGRAHVGGNSIREHISCDEETVRRKRKPSAPIADVRELPESTERDDDEPDSIPFEEMHGGKLGELSNE